MNKHIKITFLILAIAAVAGLAIFIIVDRAGDPAAANEATEVTSLPTHTPAPSISPVESDEPDPQPSVSKTLLPQPTRNSSIISLLNSGDYSYEESVFFECPSDEFVSEYCLEHFFDENNDLICLGYECLIDDLSGEERYPEYFFRIKNNTHEKISPLLADQVILENGVRKGSLTYGAARDAYGNHYVILSHFDGGGELTHHSLNIFDQNYNIVEEGIPFDAEEEFSHSCAVYDNKIYSSCNAQLTINDLSGKKVDPPVELSRSPFFSDINIDAQGILYFLGNEKASGLPTYDKFDLNTNRFIYETRNMNYKGGFMRYGAATDSLYAANNTGVYRFDAATGAYVGKELNFGTDTSFLISVPDTVLIDVLPDDMGNIYIIIGDRTSGQRMTRILKYTLTLGIQPKEAAEDDNRKEIVYTANYLDDFISDAINNFNFNNKEIKIVPDVVYETREEMYMVADQATANYATRIMANDVGDIVATGGMGLDYYNVLHTDAFVDLSEYVRNDKNYANLNQAALNSLTFDGKLNGLPVGIALHGVLEFNTGLNDELRLGLNPRSLKWSDIINAAQSLESGRENLTLFSYDNLDGMLIDILITNMPDLMNLEDKTYNLKQDWFIDLLNDLKSIEGKDNLFSDRASMPFLFRSLGARTFISQYEYRWPMETVAPIAGEANRNRVAYTTHLYSISARSENKDDAWEFLSFLLEDEQMTLPTLDSVPLNNKSADLLLEKHDEERQALYRDISRSIDFMYDFGLYKKDIVDPVMRFMNDSIALDEALEQAEYNIWLRMNE